MGRLLYDIFTDLKSSESRKPSNSVPLITLMMEAVSSSETSVNIYQTTWHNIPRRQNLQVESYLQAECSTCTAGHNLCIVLYTIHPNSSHIVFCSPGHSTQNRFTANHRSKFLKFKTDFMLHISRQLMYYQVSIRTEICFSLYHLLLLFSMFKSLLPKF
jgi:hypothetical protein